MTIASMILRIFSWSPMMMLFIVWSIAQLFVHTLFNRKYPEHDSHGFKSVVVAHNLYRSIICFIFFLGGMLIWDQSIKPMQFTNLMTQQEVLLKTSAYYMIGDLIFGLLSHHVSRLRLDLVLHHVIALMYMALCWYTGTLYAWSFVCVTELLSVWTGLGSYAIYMEYDTLRRFCYFTRMVTIVAWRIPWWVTAVSCLNLFHLFLFKLVLVCGITVILAMDLFWLHKCIKGMQYKN